MKKDDCLPLSEFLARETCCRLAVAADDAGVLEFFHSTGLAGRGVQFAYRLAPDFASFHHLRAPRHLTFLLHKKDGALGGLATLSLRPGYVHGREQMVGYFSDLRMAKDRQVVRDWRLIMRRFLTPGHGFDELAGCRHFYGAVIADNQLALNAFSGGRQGGLFTPYADYRITHLLGRRPRLGWARAPAGAFRLRYATGADQAALMAFLDREERYKAYGYAFATHEFAFRLQHWPGLKVEDFLLAVDAEGAVVGCTAPWSPDPYKQTILRQGPQSLAYLARFMRATRMPGRKHLPLPGEVIRILYLSHLSLSASLGDEQQLALRAALIDRVYEDFVAPSASPWQFLAFADLSGGQAPGLSRYLAHTIAAKLLQAIQPTEIVPTAPAAFEMATV